MNYHNDSTFSLNWIMAPQLWKVGHGHVGNFTKPCIIRCRYEKSYMHRDVVTHVAVSAADFFISGSTDGKRGHINSWCLLKSPNSLLYCPGHLKFWKKKPTGIEFAKHFRSHLGPIEGLAVSSQRLTGSSIPYSSLLSVCLNRTIRNLT